MINTHPIRFVFLHGGPGMDSSYLQSFAESFSHLGEVVTYDQGTKRNISKIDDLIIELEDVIESKPKPVILIGHSFGGTLACKILERSSASKPKILGIITICSPLDFTWSQSLLEQSGHQAELDIVDQKIKALNKSLSPDEKFKAETLCWLPFYFTKDFQLQGMKILESIHYNAELFELLSQSFMRDFDLSDALSKAEVPIFSIWSSSDRIIPFEYSRKKPQTFPNILHSFIEDAGHFSFVEKPQEVKRLIEIFIFRMQKKLI